MRGSDGRSGSLFSYVDLEARVRRDHPLRAIREIANAALALSGRGFRGALPARLGRPSIAPEKLLRAMLLQAFYGIRSERQLMERMEFDLLFRWFVGLGVDDPVWDHSSFSKNRDRLLEGEIAAKFLRAVLAQPKVKRLLSSDHFSVDGTLIEAWASIKSFRRKDGQRQRPARSGPQCRARLPQGEALQRDAPEHDRPGGPALQEGRRPAGQALLHGPRPDGEPPWPGGGRRHEPGHRHGRAGDGACNDGPAGRGRRRITLGADKAYDVRQFVAGSARAATVTPHIAIDGHLQQDRQAARHRHRPTHDPSSRL